MQTINEKLAVKETLLQLFDDIAEKQRALSLEARALNRIEKFEEAKTVLNKASGIQVALNIIKEKLDEI